VVPPEAGFFEADRVTALEDVAQEVSFALDAFARRAAQAELQRVHKLDAMARLTGGIVHNFNNLLSVMLSYSRMMLSELSEDHPLREDVAEIHRAGERGAAMTRQLLAFSRQRVVESRRFDLNDFLAGMEPMVQQVLGEKIQLSLRITAGTLPIHADPGQIEQALLNLVVNARDAMPRGGTLAIATSRAGHLHLPGQAVLSVSDTGVGMGDETRARLFEPFFTTKERAAGLGLATVFGIVRQAGGWIFVDSEVGRGTTVRIQLPMAAGGDD